MNQNCDHLSQIESSNLDLALDLDLTSGARHMSQNCDHGSQIESSILWELGYDEVMKAMNATIKS